MNEEDLETHLRLPYSRYNTKILRENGESFHNSKFEFIQVSFSYNLRLPYIMGGFNKLQERGKGGHTHPYSKREPKSNK